MAPGETSVVIEGGRLTVGDRSVFLVGILVFAAAECSLGDPAGEAARRRFGSVEGLVAEAPRGTYAVCPGIKRLVSDLRGSVRPASRL
jgi:hypothetical protein